MGHPGSVCNDTAIQIENATATRKVLSWRAAPSLLGVSGLPLPQQECTEDRVALAEVLIIADCRAVARSIAVNRGTSEGLAKRREVIEKAHKDIDEKAGLLAAHRNGTNNLTQCKVDFMQTISGRVWTASP
jgi:hypothetical protein